MSTEKSEDWGLGMDREVAAAPLVNDKHRRRASRPVAQCYLVQSPEWSEGGYNEPPEYGRDFVFVFTRNVKRAKVLAVRWFRHTYRTYRERYHRDYLAPGENPFNGMTVEQFNNQERGESE